MKPKISKALSKPGQAYVVLSRCVSLDILYLVNKISKEDVTRITATSYLNQLGEMGLLESEKVGREKIYKNTRLIKLLSEN